LLPVFNDPKAWRFRSLARLWTVIFVANLLGAAISAAAVALGGAFGAEQLRAFDDLAKETVAPSSSVMFTKAIFGGWILALMVWLLPLAEQLAPVIIILLTYVIAAGQLSHAIAGSVDALYGVGSAATTLGDYVHFIVPTFLGNVVGGVAFVAAISSAEIAAERGGAHRKKIAPG
jgi:formate/nitrite transporter FocA (FNT family)